MNQVDKKQLLESYLKEKGLYKEDMTNQEKLKALQKLSDSYTDAMHNAERFINNSDNSNSANKWSYVARMNKKNFDQVQEHIKFIKTEGKQKLKLFGRKRG